MKRSTKWMVVALTVMAVTASLGVASASASRVAAEKYPATLLGATTGTQRITLSNLPTTCKQSSLSGTLAKPGDPFVANVTYGECSYYLGSMSVNTGTCTYQYNIGEETSPGHFNGTLTIGPAGCAITLTAPGCKQTIPAQSAHASVTYTNTGSGSETKFLVDADVTGLTYTAEGFNCSTSSTTNGRIEGEWLVAGRDAAGSGIGAWIESHAGLYVTGTKGGEIPPSLTAEVLPASISGQQSSTNKQKIVTGSGTFECSNVSFSGGISSASTQFDLTPSYSGCSLAIFGSSLSATANANGCTYRYTVTSSSPYTGTVSLVCAEGKSLEVTAAGCVLKIPAQTLGTVTYTNSIGQTGRSVITSASGSKLSYSSTGFTCGNLTGSNGTYSGGSILQ
jgi:hypothetical protein